ncbi:hypothetical protein OIU85_015240 [Salix viminalis]|uniref:Uncharacterized protein n=1 Tax=Salix viminalis TaxID=40686 RepID=A0A9Q0SBZ2_SALVM|nr:hypothetical protein OIU85_015240 [Salix viminalis]
MHVASGAEALARGLIKKLAHEPSHGFVFDLSHQECRSDWPPFLSVKHHDPTASTNYFSLLQSEAIQTKLVNSVHAKYISTVSQERHHSCGGKCLLVIVHRFEDDVRQDFSLQEVRIGEFS